MREKGCDVVLHTISAFFKNSLRIIYVTLFLLYAYICYIPTIVRAILIFIQADCFEFLRKCFKMKHKINYIRFWHIKIHS